VVFAIHGGAGTIRRSDLTPEQERAYREALTTALEAGRGVLRGGGEGTPARSPASSTSGTRSSWPTRCGPARAT